MTRTWKMVSAVIICALVLIIAVTRSTDIERKEQITERSLPSDSPSSVLIVANSTPGTQSLEVAEYYSRARGIPAQNVVALPMTSTDEISWVEFDSNVRAPLKALLQRQEFLGVRYIVPVFGVPYRLRDLPIAPRPELTQSGFSLDLFLASLFSDNTRHWIENPYRAFSTNAERPRFVAAQSRLPWRMFLVTRIEGSSAEAAKGLVDRSVAAEQSLKKTDGVGYFDFRGLGVDCGDYCDADLTMRRAYQECRRRGLRCELNDQAASGGMIEVARDALWAWGWYSPNSISGEYEFIPGAVGAQLTSYSANVLRRASAGGWVYDWLERGITATWGATAEPYSVGYAQGDVLLANFWRGYNFAESAYLSLPQLNWMMVFVGDPLYAPQVFRVEDRVSPRILNVRVSEQRGRRMVTWTTDERADTAVKVDHDGRSLEVGYEGFFALEHQMGVGDMVSGRLVIVSCDLYGNCAEAVVD